MVVVAGGHQAHLETVAQVAVGEPLEAAVRRVELDQPLELRIVAGPVRSLVRVRDDQHVLGVRALAQPLVEGGQAIGVVDRDARPFRPAEEDVVVAAAVAKAAPFVAEDRGEPPGSGELARQLLQRAPFAVVHPDVVLGEGDEVEPRVVDRVLEKAASAALAFGQAGVRVGVAPVDPPLRIVLDPDRVAPAVQPAIFGADLEARDRRRCAGRNGCTGRSSGGNGETFDARQRNARGR